MGCLYCGKEIGPFRLIRDDEFCSNVHRKQYKERLGKALVQLDGPQVAPAPPTDFVCQFPFQSGNIRYYVALDGFNHKFDMVQYRRALPLTLTPLLGGTPLRLLDANAVDATQPRSSAPFALPGYDLRVLPTGLGIALDVADEDREFAVPPGMARPMEFSPAAVDAKGVAAGDARTVAGSLAERKPDLNIAAGAARLSRAEQTRPLQVSTAPVRSSHVTPAATIADMASEAVRLPRFEVAAADACMEPVPVPVDCQGWMPGLAAEAVAVEVVARCMPESCRVPVAAILPRFEIAAADACLEPLPAPVACQGWMPGLAAEAVAVEVVARCMPESCRVPMAAILPRFEVAAADACLEPLPAPVACQGWMPGLAAEAVAVEVVARCMPESCRVPVAAILPHFEVAARTGGRAMPAACNVPMASAAAEAVAVEVIWGFHAENCGVPEAMLPDLRGFAIADPWMPISLRPRPSLTAEPVSMDVWPLAAMAEESGYEQAPEPQLPGVRYLPVGGGGAQSTPLQPAAASLQPKVAARIAVPECNPVQVAAQGARVLEMPAILRQELHPRTRLAGQAANLDAEPVETMPTCETRQATPLAPVVELQLPVLPEPQAKKLSIAPRNPVMPSMVHPAMVAAVQHPIEVKPLPTLFVAPPQATQPEQQAATMAARGFVALEFFSQRSTGTPARKMVWCTPAIAPILPAMTVHAILERLEREPQQKKAKKPAFAEIFELPEAARKRAGNAVMRHAIKAIAACFLMGTVFWFGLGTMRVGNQTPAVNRDVSGGEVASSTAPGVASPVGASGVGGGASAAKPAGTIARVRAAIADRAAATVTDSFKNGMEAWGTASKQWAPGWSHNPDGYVRTGQLALFHPTLSYKDYRLEFFGQIENKSMGWAVRAHDKNNYYAMKLSVIEPGLRPVIAMVHYPVVGGKRGRPVEIPLNVMVHNNRPLQVSVDVRGNKLLTSVDGQLVDTWIDDTLVAGGVGFFSDTGERARLYWMKISKNEDFLGRICAYVSNTLGDGTNATAELWHEAPPAPQHQPPVPERSQEAALAETAAGLQNRLLKDRRSERWNS